MGLYSPRETDIGEVLQVQDVVFTNVSKGEIAKKDLIQKCFGTSNVTEVNSKTDIKVTARPKTGKSHVLLLMHLNYPCIAWNNFPKFHENWASSF